MNSQERKTEIKQAQTTSRSHRQDGFACDFPECDKDFTYNYTTQISSITEVIQNMVAPILSMPPSIPDKRESQIFSVTKEVRSMLAPLASSPQQRELLVTLVTERLRNMLSLILSLPSSTPAQREFQISSITKMVRNMLSTMVPVPSVKKEIIDLTPSGFHPIRKANNPHRYRIPQNPLKVQAVDTQTPCSVTPNHRSVHLWALAAISDSRNQHAFRRALIKINRCFDKRAPTDC